MVDTFGIDQDKRTTVPTGLRRSGVTGGTGIFDKYFNQILFELRQNHIWGTQSQVTNGDATIYVNASGNPLDKDDSAATLIDDDKILITYDATLTGNLIFNPVSSVRLNIDMLKGSELDFGDAGSGEPYKLIIGTNVKTGSKINLRGSQGFIDLPFALTGDQKRFISNQAVGVMIKYNEDIIYDPGNVGNVLMKDSWPNNPYLVRMNGQQLNWKIHATPATNNTLAWFRDLNKFLHGYRDGNETQSRFTLPAVIAANPQLFQVNTPNGMMRDISTVDPDIHERTDANGVSTAATADFTNASSIVTFQTSIGNIKNFMRLNGASAQGIPDGVSGTTILIDIDETARTATMVDALTFAEVTATSTVAGIATTIDNSGAAGGSLQANQNLLHWHYLSSSEADGEKNIADQGFADNLGSRGLIEGYPDSSSGGGTKLMTTRKNGSGSSVGGTETRPENTDVFYFYQG